MLEDSPPYLFGIMSKLGLWYTKMSKMWNITCWRPTVHISFQISFTFGRWLGMLEDSPPYLFGRVYV